MLMVFLFPLLSSCNVQEGPGGMGSISGRIFVKNYNGDFSQLKETYYAPEESVYLIYGEEKIYGDDVKTHFDGSFKFDYLRKGNYQVFAYSKDSTGNVASGVVPVIIDVEISSRSQEVDIGDIIVLK